MQKKDTDIKAIARKRATLTIDEFASLTGVSRYTLYHNAKQGLVPTVRLAGRILIPSSFFSQFLV